MATQKFYLSNSAAGLTPTATAWWEDASGAFVGAMTAAATGTNSPVSVAEVSASGTYDGLLGVWVSPPMLRAGTLDASGTAVDIGIAVQASVVGDLYSSFTVRVVTSAGALRGYLLTNGGANGLATASSPWGTTLTGRLEGPAASLATSVACQPGDRVVLEYGFRATNTVTTSRSGTLRYGGTAPTDVTAGNTGTNATTRPAWIRFTGGSVSDLWVAPPDPLAQWKTATAAVGSSRARLAVFADSQAEGQGASVRANRWQDVLLSTLRSRLGVSGGGRGAVPAKYEVYSPDSPWGTTGIATTGSVDDFAAGPFGQRGRILNASATLTWTVQGTHAQLWYGAYSGMTAFTYRVDGGSAVTVSATSPASATWTPVAITLGSSGSHTVQVETSGSQSAFVGGLVVWDGDSTAGVTLLDAAKVGITAATYASNASEPDSTSWRRGVSDLAPDLVIVALGLNDWNDQVATATTVTNLQTIVTALRALTKVPSIVIVAPKNIAPNANTATITWAAYITAYQNMVTADGNLTFLDLDTPMAGTGSPGGTYWTTDWHPTDAGHAMIAGLVADAIQPATSTTGVIAGGLPAATGSAAGTVADTGALAATGPVASSSLSGIATTAGALASSFPSATGTAAGGVTASGGLTGSAPATAAALTGGIGVPGALAAGLPTPEAAITGSGTIVGATAAVAPVPSGALTGAVIADGQLAGGLPAPLAVLGGDGSSSGLLVGLLTAPTGAAAGTVTDPGAMAAGLPAAAAAFAGLVATDGSALAATLPGPSAAVAGTVTATATMSAQAPAPAAAVTGAVLLLGTFTGPAPIPTAAVQGAVRAPGQLSATGPVLVARLNRTEDPMGLALWDGTEWVEAIAQVWDGAAWVPALVEIT